MRIGGPAVVGLLAALVVTIASGGVAQAQQVQCQVLSITASTTGSTVAPALAPYRSQLMRPPLNAFTSFALASSQQLRLGSGGPQPLRLGHNITGELSLQSAAGGRQRLRLVLRRAGQTLVNTQLAISAGHPFFVAGPIIPGGTLVIGIVCR